MKDLKKFPLKPKRSRRNHLVTYVKQAKKLAMTPIILAASLGLAACNGTTPDAINSALSKVTGNTVSTLSTLSNGSTGSTSTSTTSTTTNSASSYAKGRTVKSNGTWVGTLSKTPVTPNIPNYPDLTGSKIYFSCEEYTDGSSFSRYWMQLPNGTLVKNFDQSTDAKQNCASQIGIRQQALQGQFQSPNFAFSIVTFNENNLKLGTTYAGLRVVSAVSQVAPDKQASAIRQISGLSLTNDMRAGFRMAEASGQGINQRLAALSSHLAITNGAQAISRAHLTGDLSHASQTSVSLANQSLDAGVAGMWVSLTNNNGVTGSNLNGIRNHLQAGQDVALSPELTVGVAASSSSLSQTRTGDTPSYLSGTVISANIYMAYSPDRVRLTAQASGQSGSVENYRTISTQQNDVAYGHTGFTGSSAEMRIGYELGNNAAATQNPISLIPSIAVGYRAQSAASYSERASRDYLALAVPELSQNNLYAAIGLEARTIFHINDIAAMPRVSVGIERDNSRLGQNGVVALAIDPTAQFDTNLGTHNYNTTARYGFGIDMVGSDNNIALRVDYQGRKSSDEQVNCFTLGTKIGF